MVLNLQNFFWNLVQTALFVGWFWTIQKITPKSALHTVLPCIENAFKKKKLHTAVHTSKIICLLMRSSEPSLRFFTDMFQTPNQHIQDNFKYCRSDAVAAGGASSRRLPLSSQLLLSPLRLTNSQQLSTELWTRRAERNGTRKLEKWIYKKLCVFSPQRRRNCLLF